MPIVNQVERRPSAARTAEPVTVRSPLAPTSVTERTRPEAAASVRTSSSLPREPSRLPSDVAENRSGPQSWYGESVSYGSGTETRYGTGEPGHTSRTLAVRPPELE
jgi:hypothetical protein